MDFACFFASVRATSAVGHYKTFSREFFILDFIVETGKATKMMNFVVYLKRNGEIFANALLLLLRCFGLNVSFLCDV